MQYNKFYIRYGCEDKKDSELDETFVILPARATIQYKTAAECRKLS